MSSAGILASLPGLGTVSAVLGLPGTAGTSDATTRPAPEVAGRVLVVDDNGPNLALMAAILRGAGYDDVELVDDPRMVLDAVARFEPDVILLDLHMPELDGFEVMQLLSRAIPAGDFLPIIVVTADATTATRERVLSSGAKDLLIKPIDRVEVLQRTANMLETRRLNQQFRAQHARLELGVGDQAEQERLEAARDALRGDVRRVLDERRLRSVFQPIVEIGSGAMIGVEALVRVDTEIARCPASLFSEAAEIGLGGQLELAAIHSALSRLDELPDDVYVSLNCSRQVLGAPELEVVLEDVDPLRIVLEITDHHTIDDDAAIDDATLRDLRRRGIRMAVDDVGADLGTLNHVHQLDPDILKLDLALTRAIDTHPAQRALVSALVTFAAEIGATLVAKGVETVGELDALSELGVSTMQGYLLGRPQTPPVSVNAVATRATDPSSHDRREVTAALGDATATGRWVDDRPSPDSSRRGRR